MVKQQKPVEKKIILNISSVVETFKNTEIIYYQTRTDVLPLDGNVSVLRTGANGAQFKCTPPIYYKSGHGNNDE